MTPASLSSILCSQCGFCCDGTIFADVQFQEGDPEGRLRRLLNLRPGRVKFCQPCVALDGKLCRIYKDRPRHCQNFECLLFKAILADESKLPAALRTVRTSQRLVERIRRRLRELGYQDEHLPLGHRLRRLARRLEREALSSEAAAIYGELTLDAHRWNGILQRKFYPG